jgi:hypothetical protein
VRLRWTAPADEGGLPLAGYMVHRGATPGSPDWSQALDLRTEFIDTGLVPGTTYYYTVRARNQLGEGLASAEVAGRAPSPPPAPTSVSARPFLGAHFEGSLLNPKVGGIRVEWAAPGPAGDPVTSYKVYRGAAPGQEALVREVTAFFYQDNDVQPFTCYTYRVSAVGPGGEGPRSAPVASTSYTSLGLGPSC